MRGRGLTVVSGYVINVEVPVVDQRAMLDLRGIVNLLNWVAMARDKDGVFVVTLQRRRRSPRPKSERLGSRQLDTGWLAFGNGEGERAC